MWLWFIARWSWFWVILQSSDYAHNLDLWEGQIQIHNLYLWLVRVGRAEQGQWSVSGLLSLVSSRRLLSGCQRKNSIWQIWGWNFKLFLQLGLFWQPSDWHKCEHQVPGSWDTQPKQVSYDFSIWAGHHHFNHQNCIVSLSCWSGMLATMSGWKAMLEFCQKPFLSNWHRYKSQVMNTTPHDLTCVDLRLLDHQTCFRSYVLRPRRWFWLLCWGRPGDLRTQTWHNVLE